MSGFDFDPDKEPATVQIRVNPNKYVKVNKKMLSCNRVTEDDIGDDGQVTQKVRWDESHATAWVPPRVADMLTGVNRKESFAGVGPIANVVGSRTIEDAGGGKTKIERRPVTAAT